MCEKLELEDVVVGGLSMGGYVALAFARKYPRLTAGLVLADTRSGADNESSKAARDLAIAAVAAHGVHPYCQQLVPTLVSVRNPSACDFALSIATMQSPAGVAGALGALRDRPDATSHLSAITAPTLVLVGAEDTLTPRTEAEKLARGIPGAELVEIPDAGHLSAIEQPARFAVAVDRFLHRLK